MARWLSETEIQRKRLRKHRSEDRIRGELLFPQFREKTLHLSIICGFLLGAITGWLTTITTHLSGRENRCLDKPHSYHTPVIFVM